ncbi:MAG: exopolysaccharide biosynthesis polyprenyl glycosylphosphotransferase [Lachnospiraceae bacterium]|nr:exopolysaccharide biosynthesis polyprenyl glycosylphosphotransferase [Lachnospiraceae bacterium]
MKKREQYKRLVRFLLTLLNVAILTGIYAYFWFTYYHERQIIGVLYFRRGHWAILSLYAVLIYFFGKVYGSMKVGYLRVLDVLLSQVLVVVIVNAITYVQLALIGRWSFGDHLTPILWMTGFDFIAVCLWLLLSHWVYATIFPAKEILLIYGDRSPRSFIKKIATRRDKYIIRESVCIEERSDEYIKERIDHYNAVMIGDLPAQRRNDFLKYCFEKDVLCYSVPKISDIMMMSSETINLFDTALQLFRNRGLSAEQRMVKRIMDIVLSLLMLAVASPFMLVIALLIKGYDGGPVFYRQDRLTRGGEVFQIYKFRSMVVDSEARGARLCARGDARITPVGRVIRNLHLDELPQLINILKGDMSLVGPRPERPEIAAEYRREIPEFDYRLKVKAGLTGYAQVYGKYNTTPYDKLKLDLYYIENYSVWMDLKLCMLTFKILFQKENTEGVDPSQKTASVHSRKNDEKRAQ